LVFDRGGFSADAFRFLQADGIGFITYLRGRKRHRHMPVDRFQRSWLVFEEQRHVYFVHEKASRVGRAWTFRTILFLGDEDQQIPVVTNLVPPTTPAKIVPCLQLRWRQENSLKFLHEHYAVEQLIQYGADPEAPPRRVPNPKRKTLTDRVCRVTQEIQTLEADVGRAVAPMRNANGRPRGASKLLTVAFAANWLSTGRCSPACRIASATRPARSTRRTEAGKTRSLLRGDRRLVVNALKLVAANAERLLALGFLRY
jgi:hypothetical protein